MLESDKRKAQKGKLADGRRHPLYHYHRYISWIITKQFLALSISANMATVLMLATWLIGSLMIISPWPIASPVILYISFILDKCDGELARFNDTISRFGEYIDEMFHIFSWPILLLAFTRFYDEASGIAVACIIIFVIYKYERKLQYKMRFRNLMRISEIPEWFVQDDIIILVLLVSINTDPVYFLYYFVLLFSISLAWRAVLSFEKLRTL